MAAWDLLDDEGGLPANPRRCERAIDEGVSAPIDDATNLLFIGVVLDADDTPLILEELEMLVLPLFSFPLSDEERVNEVEDLVDAAVE